MIKKILKPFYKKRLRWIMRGHRELKKNNSSGKIYQVMHAVISTPLLTKQYSRKIFGNAVDQAELITRQYLISRTILGTNFSKALLYTIKHPNAWVTHPLPPEWRKVVRDHGFILPELWASLIWNGFVFIIFIFGLLSIWKIVFTSIKTLFTGGKPDIEDFVYFVGLTKNNTPQALSGEISHDIISWYCQWPDRQEKIGAICHDVKGVAPCSAYGIPVVNMPFGISSLRQFGILMRYISWALTTTFFCIIDLFRGRWWHAFLLNEASLSRAVRMQSAQKLARDYLFHNSNWVYRPLWTYEAARKGSKITFYFYSTTSGDGFKRANGNYPLPYFGYAMMNWPQYLVWNNYQANSIRQLVGEQANVRVVGPIWFHSSEVKLPALPSKAIAVFDVQPVRDSFYQSFGIDFDYYTPGTAIQFLSDIATSLIDGDWQFILKRKRNIGRLVHPKYRHFIKNLAKKPNFVSIDPDVSAVQLIKNCNAVISMPFTSTAIIARELGKPSIYYDPQGLIQKDDKGAHGVNILCGLEELSAWLTTLRQ